MQGSINYRQKLPQGWGINVDSSALWLKKGFGFIRGDNYTFCTTSRCFQYMPHKRIHIYLLNVWTYQLKLMRSFVEWPFITDRCCELGIIINIFQIFIDTVKIFINIDDTLTSLLLLMQNKYILEFLPNVLKILNCPIVRKIE